MSDVHFTQPITSLIWHPTLIIIWLLPQCLCCKIISDASFWNMHAFILILLEYHWNARLMLLLYSSRLNKNNILKKSWLCKSWDSPVTSNCFNKINNQHQLNTHNYISLSENCWTYLHFHSYGQSWTIKFSLITLTQYLMT